MNAITLAFAVLLGIDLPPGILDDLEKSFKSLQQAESNKDAAQVKKLAADVFRLAGQVTSASAPEDAAEKEAWTNRVSYVRDIQVRAEYALYVTAIQAPPAVTVDLMGTLEQGSPKSRYLDEGYARYFLALTQTGAGAKIPAIAEKALANFPNNDDLLLILADTAMNRKQSDRALGYARRLVAAVPKHAKPEGMSAADWDRKRNVSLGRGYWIAGIVLSEKTQYFEADKNLRAALPLVQGNDAMRAAALFNLGVANYQLGRTTLNKAQVIEAAKFSEQCAAISGPYQQQAWTNAAVMKREADRMR
jgi:tetratricopeptide (TPR) repeat protein